MLVQVMQMDILPTLEGVPVIFHDLNLKRATGLDADIRQVLTAGLGITVSNPFSDVGQQSRQETFNGTDHASLGGWIGCLGEASHLQGVPCSPP